MNGSEFDGSQLSEYNGVTLKPVWTLNKRGLAAMTLSLSAAIKAAFGNMTLFISMQRAHVPCCGFQNFLANGCGIAMIHGIG